MAQTTAAGFHKVQSNHSLTHITWPAEPYSESSDTAKQSQQHSEGSTDSPYLTNCNQDETSLVPDICFG